MKTKLTILGMLICLAVTAQKNDNRNKNCSIQTIGTDTAYAYYHIPPALQKQIIKQARKHKGATRQYFISVAYKRNIYVYSVVPGDNKTDITELYTTAK